MQGPASEKRENRLRRIARLDFEIEPTTLAALIRHRAEIAKCAQPRVLEELYRLLRGGAAHRSMALLIETGGYRDLASRVLVIDCSERVQIERTMQRSGLTEAQTRAIIASQASREQRLSAANDIIDNNSGLAELAEQVKALHARYTVLANVA